MENKQTAVEWLEDEFSRCVTANDYKIVFRIAKMMEKEQIKDAHLIGLISSMEMEATKQAEQYYNETYGNI